MNTNAIFHIVIESDKRKLNWLS